MPGGKQTSRRVLHPYRSQEDIADGKSKIRVLKRLRGILKTG